MTQDGGTNTSSPKSWHTVLFSGEQRFYVYRKKNTRRRRKRRRRCSELTQ